MTPPSHEPSAGGGDDPPAEPGSDANGTQSTARGVTARLEALRRDDRRRRTAFAVAVVIGLAASTVHWLGLVAGGALVGIVQRGLPRAIGAALVFGGVVAIWTVLTVPTLSPAALSDLSPVSYLAVAAVFVFPVWGALVRGVF